MFKNYFILNRLVIELNEILACYKIMCAYSYEKDRLNLILSKNFSEEVSIEISVNPGFPYLNLRQKISLPKKNVLDFFQNFLPAKLDKAEISDRDRVIRFSSDESQIYFTIRGKYTNVFAVNKNGVIESFKKTSDELKNNFLAEAGKLNFISTFNNIHIEDSEINQEVLKKTYPFIGKEILNEAIVRKKNIGDKITGTELNKVLQEIRENNPVVFTDENTNEVNLGIKGFNISPGKKTVEFEKLTEAFNYFLSQRFSMESISGKKKIIEKHLERELKNVSAKLKDLNARIERGTKEDEFKKFAELILINLDKIHKRKSEVELNDIYNNNASVKIKINPSLSPSQNADYYFEKARNEKINLEKATQLKTENGNKYESLKEIEKKFNNAETPDDYNSILKELKIKIEQTVKQEDEIKSKFKHYLLENKYHVYVGKDSKSNDLLTLKFAKQNDYWFHARSVSGSHVVLKVEKLKEGMPKNILKISASIAAYHSKAKTSGLVPVSYTQMKYVVKKKGMGPGKVALLKEDVLIVKPEIPKGVEFLNSA